MSSDFAPVTPSTKIFPFDESTPTTFASTPARPLESPSLLPLEGLPKSPRWISTVSPTLTVTDLTPANLESLVAKRALNFLRLSWLDAFAAALRCFLGLLLYTFLNPPHTFCLAVAAILGQRSAASLETGPLISEP